LQCAPPSHPDHHQWYYTSEMQPDEAVLFQDFRLEAAGWGRDEMLPHGFQQPRGSWSREIVIWEDQPLEK
jgi:hypothetical protein